MTVSNPVQSGSRFEVRATVENKVSEAGNVNLLFEAPTNCTFDSKILPSECVKHDRVFAENQPYDRPGQSELDDELLERLLGSDEGGI